MSSIFDDEFGHHRLRQNGDLPDHFGGHIQHRSLTLRVGFRQRPWRLAREIAIGFRHHGPDRVQPVMDLLGAHRSSRDRDHAVGQRQDRLVVVAEGARLGQHAAKLLCDHRQRALREIAEIVGEIGIDARHNGFVIIIAVLPERHLAQEEIPHLIDAVLVGEVEGIDNVADRFRHLLAAVEQEAVRIDAFLHGNAGRHQECRPIHRVEADDVLADDVHVSRPDSASSRSLSSGKPTPVM